MNERTLIFIEFMTTTAQDDNDALAHCIQQPDAIQKANMRVRQRQQQQWRAYITTNDYDYYHKNPIWHVNL